MAAMDSEDPPPPLVVLEPAPQTAAVIFASPHSGAHYPPEFLVASRLTPHTLRRSEDFCVDRLFSAAPSRGAPLISATFPRAYCDPNREPWELDPSMFEDPLPAWVTTSSVRIGAGLGTIPRIVASGEAIYDHKLRFAEAEARIRLCWEPYHQALRELLDRTRANFGRCLLVDCHSMPSMTGGATPDIVLGDAHGTSCAGIITRQTEEFLRLRGYSLRRNDPYAGGFVTRHYGRPRDQVHGLQIEIARRLYMDEHRMEPHGGFRSLQRDLSDLVTYMTSDGFLPS
jgi:N-formylglutamate amidohydrolase